MKITRLSTEHCRPEAWKNGGGITTELARHVEDGRWLWRLSVARIERAGAFSDFTGYRRATLLLDGRGIVLSFDKAPTVIIDRLYRPCEFDGEWKTECRLLDGPVTDLNFIFDAGRLVARVEVLELQAGSESRTPLHEEALVYVADGDVDVNGGDGSFALKRSDLLRVEAPVGSTLVATARGCRAAVVVIHVANRPKHQAGDHEQVRSAFTAACRRTSDE
jgi:uncharacterized protein